MKFIEIVGADTVGVLHGSAAAVTAQEVQNPDRIDAAADKGVSALRAVQTLSMFEPSRVVVVTTPEKVSVAVARDLAKLTHPGAVIFTGEKPVTASVRKALPDLESHKHPLPRANEASQWVQARFAEVQVALPADVADRLAEVATTAHGASRIRHLAELLHSCGFDTPDHALLDTLTADLGASEAIWAASDAVTRGNLPGARPSEEAEPIVALSMLARRLARIGAILEGQAEPQELAALFETREGAVHMMAKGVQTSPTDVGRAFDLVIDAAARCRQVSDPVLTRAVAESASMRAAEIFQAA